jgi:hypothetical protein
MLKKVGPAFPIPGPHYDYSDLIEHIRHSLLNLCTCDPNELPEYHLLEIYGRRLRLAERSRDIAQAVPEGDYEHYRRHLDELVRNWEEDFKKYFTNCRKDTRT